MLFNPTKSRDGYLKDNRAVLNHYLNTAYVEGKPMGNIASGLIGTALNLALVGLSKEIEPAIPRALEWLDIALEKDEASWFGDVPDFHRETLHWARAIGYWFYTGKDLVDAWSAALKFESLAQAQGEGVWPKKDAATRRLDDHMAFCVLAGRYEQGVAEYEKYHGNTAPSMKKKLSPREMGYAICLHHSHGKFSPDEILLAGQKMLSAKLEEDWFGMGQFIRGATWLKIVYSSQLHLSPVDVILKAYECMPNVSQNQISPTMRLGRPT